MKFREFVLKNTLRNKNLYMAYFLSTLMTVMTFFAFTVFAFHPQLSNDTNIVVKMGMVVSCVIIYIFSFFYVLYSMDIFLQSRKKEFGVLLIQGMSPKQLRKMVFQENNIIGFFATIFGSLAGIVLSEFLLLLSKVTIQVELPFYFPLQAIIITFVSFTCLFLFISFFIQFKIPKMDVQELLKSQDLGKGEVKASIIKTLLAIILIGSGFTRDLNTQGKEVLEYMLLVIFFVILGTKFLFDQVSIYVVNLLKKNKKRFWKKTNMLIFSDLGFRMKDNARSFFLVAIITTVAISALGTLVGFKEMSLRDAKESTFDITIEATKDNEATAQNQIDAVNNALTKQNTKANEVKIDALSVDGSLVRERQNVNILDVNTYNKIADIIKEKRIELSNQEVVRLEGETRDIFGVAERKVNNFQLEEGNSLTIRDIKVNKTIWPKFVSTYVVDNDTYQQLANSYDSTVYYGWLMPNVSSEDKSQLGDELESFDDLTIKANAVKKFNKIYAPTLFIGFFIGIVFFISAGSFLYSRLYSDMTVDIEKFKMIYKIGFSKKEMKKVVYQQVAILFITPIIVTCINGLVALKAMYAIFYENLQIASLYVLVAFVVVQVAYYLIARFFYFRKLYRSVVD